VRGIDTASRNKEAPAFVAFVFQVSKHLVECQIDDSRHIFSNNPSGPEFPDNSKHFRPEVTVIFLASSLPSKTEWLTGESSRNNVNCSQSCSLIKTLLRKCPNVPPFGNIGPVLGKYRMGIVGPFALPHGSEASPLRSQVKASNPGKQAQVG
jgi:hypothetical protein